MSKTDAPAEVTYRETIPLWLAVGITVVVSVPFTLWLGKYNMAVWVSFITWAEYFALGAKPAAVKLILPSFAYAAILTAVTLAAITYLDFMPKLHTKGDLAIIVALFVGICFMVYSMKWSTTFQKGTLPFFNGVSMVLAVYFTGSFPNVVTGHAAPLFAGVWTILLGVFGVLLALFNVWITFPRPVRGA